MKVNPRDYIIASTGQQYRECHELRRKIGDNNKWEFTFPTLCAYREGKLVGYISRHPNQKMLIFNNLTLDPDLSKNAKTIIAMRMIEALEIFLQHAGIKWYWFPVDKDNTELKDFLGKGQDLSPQHEDSMYHWYKREMH